MFNWQVSEQPILNNKTLSKPKQSTIEFSENRALISASEIKKA